VQNIIVDTVFGVVINPRQMDIIPNLNNNGQLVVMLVTRRKRKRWLRQVGGLSRTAQALLVSGGLLDFPPPKVQVNEHPRAGFGTWELLVKP
jgi:hypothetical protein